MNAPEYAETAIMRISSQREQTRARWALREILFRASVSSSSFPSATRSGVVWCAVSFTIRSRRIEEQRNENGERTPLKREREREREREGGRETRGDVVTLFIHAGNERFIGPD